MSDNMLNFSAARHAISNELAGQFTDDRASQPPVRLVGFHLKGKCPRCWGDTAALCATGFRKVSTSRTQITVLKCACASTHPETPNGERGCGATWLMRVTYSRGLRTANRAAANSVTKESVDETETSSYWEGAQLANVSLANALTDFQAQASKWTAALATIVGLVGVSTLLAGQKAISGMDQPYAYIAGGLLAFALFFDILSLAIGTLASTGSPSLPKAPTIKELESVDIVPLRKAAQAKTRLWAAIASTIVTVLAAVAVIALIVYAPQSSSEARFKITLNMPNGPATATVTTSCGTFSPPPNLTDPLEPGSSLPKTVKFTADKRGAQSTTVQVSQISSVTAC